MERDFYQILGVSRNAEAEEIRLAYRRLARKYHPDVNPNDRAAKQRFLEVKEAYDVVGDPLSRKSYDLAKADYETRQKKKAEEEMEQQSAPPRPKSKAPSSPPPTPRKAFKIKLGFKRKEDVQSGFMPNAQSAVQVAARKTVDFLPEENSLEHLVKLFDELRLQGAYIPGSSDGTRIAVHSARRPDLIYEAAHRLINIGREMGKLPVMHIHNFGGQPRLIIGETALARLLDLNNLANAGLAKLNPRNRFSAMIEMGKINAGVSPQLQFFNSMPEVATFNTPSGELHEVKLKKQDATALRHGQKKPDGFWREMGAAFKDMMPWG